MREENLPLRIISPDRMRLIVDTAVDCLPIEVMPIYMNNSNGVLQMLPKYILVRVGVSTYGIKMLKSSTSFHSGSFRLIDSLNRKKYTTFIDKDLRDKMMVKVSNEI